MSINLLVTFVTGASDPAGTRYSGVIKNLNANPNVSLNTITVSGPHTLTRASVPAAPSPGNLAIAITSDEGGKASLGTETDITQTTVFNPNTAKQIPLKGGTYSFEAVSTAPGPSSSTTINMLVTIS
ncbi:MAG: hypothetical protein QXH07_06280 [Thermoplasmata archaeon]